MDAAPQLTTAQRVPPPPSGTQWTIEGGGHCAVVVEVGGGLREYSVDGVDLIDGYLIDQLCPAGAGQILAPWPNRIRDGQYSFGDTDYRLALTEPARHNAIHGLVRWARWRLVDSAPDAVTVEYEVVPQPGYPWSVLLRTTWSVGPDGLVAAHEATNVGPQPCPFGLGAHPYLRLPDVAVDELLLRVPAQSRLLLDGRALPIGAARVAGTEYDFSQTRPIGGALLDDAFGDVEFDADGVSTVELSTTDGRGVRVWADRSFHWWQVYTGDQLPPSRMRRSVAIEPMTCPPDALRSGRDLVILAPGEVWRGRWGIRPQAG